MVNAESIAHQFRQRFPGERPHVVVRAPGRVNLIGEHVDYHGGWVLPMAIEMSTWLAAGPRTDRRLVVHSEPLAQRCEWDPDATTGHKEWMAALLGIRAILRESGVEIGGANILIAGDLPIGAGLASSAAFSVGLARLFLALAHTELPPMKIAELCREAEHRYRGVPCGLMDPLACLFGRADHVLLIDCRDLSIAPIPWPREDHVVVIIDSRSPHRLSQSEYARRVDESTAAESFLKDRSQGKGYHELSEQDLAKFAPEMNPTHSRRARHVISEFARTRQAAEALKLCDMPRLGRLMKESHQSLANDYEVSSPRLDDLATIVRNTPGVLGARMTGAGFGGCVVALADVSALTAIESAVRARYDPAYDVVAPVWRARPSAGVEVRFL